MSKTTSKYLAHGGNNGDNVTHGNDYHDNLDHDIDDAHTNHNNGGQNNHGDHNHGSHSHDDQDHEEGSTHKGHDHSSHDHGHSHDYGALVRETGGRVLFWCLTITFLFSIVEGLGGYFSHSVALLTDAIHMLTDAAGLLIAFIANYISRKPANSSLSFGYGKAEVLGALINCMFTTILTLMLLLEVVDRFFHPVVVHGASLFIIASIGLVVNGFVAYILSRSSHSLNTKAAMLHAMGDMFASLVAIVAGIIIYYTQFNMADPLLSIVIIVLISISNYRLMKKSVIILMAGVPDNLNYDDIGKDLEHVEGVKTVHDLHVWYISANKASLSAHITACDPCKWEDLLKRCQKMLFEKYQIEHVTLQYEFDDDCKDRGCGCW